MEGRAGECWSCGPRPTIPRRPRRGGPSPSPASSCRRGVVRNRLVSGPTLRGRGRVVPSVRSMQDRHRAAVGRAPLSRGRVMPPRGQGSGGPPGGRGRGGGRGGESAAAGSSPHSSPRAGRARSPVTRPRCARRAPPRVLRARGGPVCVGLAAAGAVPPSHRGAPFPRRVAAASRRVASRPGSRPL